MSDANGEFIHMAEDDQGEGVKDFMSELEAKKELLAKKFEGLVQEQDEFQEEELLVKGENELDRLHNEKIKRQFEEMVKKND